MRVLICGAGIGGLATAAALVRAGVRDVKVFERAPELCEIGAGITLFTNAVKALGAIGARDAVLARAHEVGRMWTKSSDGETLFEHDVAELAQRHGAPSVCVHRTDLQSSLLAALPAGMVETGRTLKTFDATDAAVRATFDDGSHEEGDVLVGADGIRSAVRRALLGVHQPVYAGYTAWRGIAREPDGMREEDVSLFVTGPGTQAGAMRCGVGRVYWFTATNAPAGGSDPPGGARAAALRALAGWKAEGAFARLAEGTDDAAIVRSDICELPHTERWGEGRVTLLGDAAHATTPNLGQGGGMAIEDAVVLAQSLSSGDGGDVAECLRAYEDARRARARFVVDRSHAIGVMLHWENPIAVKVRDFLMATSISKSGYVRLLEALFAFEPPRLDPH
jgi:2-polyprenyl-6-methoxyphenol hydroxylase-like FAD-dependent oxidoreductase